MPARKTKSDMMAFMRELIREEPNDPRKILFAFDLDDTLIRTNSSVIVRNKGNIDKLTPAEYAIYEPKPGDTFDYIEFKRIKEPKIIKATFDLFSKVLSASNRVENAKTIILTARSPEISNDLYKFLASKGLSGVELFAVGSSDPTAKAKVVQDFIDKGFNTIRFYDDSPKNVAAVRGLGSTNPKVDIMAKLIKEPLNETGSETKDVIPGGLARGKDLTDLVIKLDPKGYFYNDQLYGALKKQLQKGIEVEMEHTSDPKIAKEIALDHLFEDPRYYIKLLRANLEEGQPKKKIKFTKPDFEYEWSEAKRYPEFKKIGKENWIEIAEKGKITPYSSVKANLNNVDLNFSNLDSSKRERFQKALEAGVIETPIAVKFADDDYDLVAGNTRLSGLVKNGIEPEIWIVDASTLGEGAHDPMNPGILKKRLGKLSCSKVRTERGKLKDKGTTYAKALQRYLNYHCQN